MSRLGTTGTLIVCCGMGLFSCGGEEGPTTVPTPTPEPVTNLEITTLPRPIGAPPTAVPTAPPKSTPTPAPTETPTPEPTPGPTPTPTPAPVPCPAKWSVVAAGTPRLLSGAINNPGLFPPDTANYDLRCVIKDVKITVHLTTATGFVAVPFPGYVDPQMVLGVCGSGVGFSGCGGSIVYQFSLSKLATGNLIGASCGDLVMDTAATTVFDPATVLPPYSGTYQWDPFRSGVGDKWRLNGLEYDLINTSNHPPDTILQCARIDITTQMVP
jgi:hypothetical protein